MTGRELGHRVDDTATDPAAPRPHGDDDRGPFAGSDDDVVGAAGTVEVVPRREPALLLLDDQQALAGDHEEAFLGVLAVVPADRLARLEDADVDAELRNRRLPSKLQ